MSDYEHDGYYLVPGYVLDRVLAIASRMNTDSAWGPFEMRDLAQEIQAKLADPEGPVDVDRLERCPRCWCPDCEEAYPRHADGEPKPANEDVQSFLADDNCAMCGGALELIGALGNLEHYRCRDCGFLASAQTGAQ